MSYGYYKMSPGSSREDYLRKVAGNTPIGVLFDQPNGVLENLPNDVLEPPKVQETLLDDLSSKKTAARAQGYSGDICTNCSGVRMKWAGHCQVCDDCGTTTGCS